VLVDILFEVLSLIYGQEFWKECLVSRWPGGLLFVGLYSGKILFHTVHERNLAPNRNDVVGNIANLK